MIDLTVVAMVELLLVEVLTEVVVEVGLNGIGVNCGQA